MNKILIANIGNRTLVQCDDKGALKEFEVKKNFREDTEFYWDSLKSGDNSVLKALAINIIDRIFHKPKKNNDEALDAKQFSHAYFFTSEQSNLGQKKARKDTIYAGELLKALFKQHNDYTHIEVHLIPLTGIPVVDLGKLVTAYQKHLENIVFVKHVNKPIILCDSGGTPQQKNALKIVTEYYLPEPLVKIYQIHEEEDDEGNIILGKGEAEKQNFIEIRKIADNRNIELLIDKGNYAAAMQVWEETAATRDSTDKSFKVLKLLRYRIELLDDFAKRQIIPNNHPDTQAQLNGLLRDGSWQKTYPAIIPFLKGEVSTQYRDWQTVIEREKFFRLCEILEVASWYWHRQQIVEVILKYHVFIERFLKVVIETNGDNPEDFYSIPSKIKHIEDNNVLSVNQLLMIQDFKELQSFYIEPNNIIRKTLQLGLDKLRNPIVHEGLSKNIDDLNNYVPTFERKIKTWHQRIGVPFEKDKNAFIRANIDLKKAMKLS